MGSSWVYHAPRVGPRFEVQQYLSLRVAGAAMTGMWKSLSQVFFMSEWTGSPPWLA
jgi:hypothetical protein